MNSLLKKLSSSIIKKQIIAITGLLLYGFLVAHLVGNCLLYLGPEAFNTYAHTLTQSPLIYPAEALLALIFLTHIILAIWLTVENKRARPESYYKKRKTGRGATFASSTMTITGPIILIFLVFHILHFKFGPYYSVAYKDTSMRNLYLVVIEYFRNPLSVVWYLFAMLALGLHLSHGLWSAFQSLGLHHPKYSKCLRLKSQIFAFLIAGGFAALPVYCYFQESGTHV